MKIDAFAHILPPHFYQKMLELEPTIHRNSLSLGLKVLLILMKD